jgi:hypothetical protein
MSNASDFIIEGNRLKEYVGSGGDVVIPEGVEFISTFAFEAVTITSLALPASLYDAPYFKPEQTQLTHISVADGNSRMTIVDGVLYNADATVMLLCPGGRTDELHVPQGVTEIEFNAMLGCQISALFLPATMAKLPEYSPAALKAIYVDEANPTLKSVDGVLYDAKMETLLCYPAGKTEEFYVPDGVKCVMLDGMSGIKSQKYQIHIGANVSVEIYWSEMMKGNAHITVYAPEGSDAERAARRYDCQFVAEGEPVAIDDTNERKERRFQDWRLVYDFSTRSKGTRITKYIRGSKIVYLPDKMGNADVAFIEKNAFPEDTAVLCSKRLFAKLADKNKLATVRAFLFDATPFAADEMKYLKEYIKKNAAHVFEAFIEEENTSAMAAALEQTNYADVVMDAAMDAAERLGRTDMKAFLLECKNKAGTVAK